MKNTCKICGKKFVASKKINVLCSPECKKNNQKINYKKYKQSEKGKKTARLYMTKFHKKRVKERKTLGICIECCKKLPLNYSKLRCEKCLKKSNTINKKRRENRKVENRCLYCGSKKICNPINIYTNKKNSEVFCEYCYLKKMAKNNLGTTKKWVLLKDLFNKQQGKCNYTGIKLIIGQNASIDHKIACKGDKNRITNINNLQWVDWKINFMKRDLDEKEFIQLCNLITSYGESRTKSALRPVKPPTK